MNRLWILVTLASALLLPACGPDEAPEVEVPSWAKVAPEQIAEAKKHGVRVAQPEDTYVPPADDPAWAAFSKEQVEASMTHGVPVLMENDLGMRFVLIPAGSFTMGSPESEKGHSSRETQHEVTISKPFYMQTTEVTNGQYRRRVPHHRIGGLYEQLLNDDDQPAADVSWDSAVRFADWVTEQDKRRSYRLPTDAEWEYACRAGTTTPYSWGSDLSEAHRYANAMDAESKDVLGFPYGIPGFDGHLLSAPTGSLLPNAWALYDMHGNVREWVHDWGADAPTDPQTDPRGPAQGRWRVVRGGSWTLWPGLLRSASRDYWHPGERRCDTGFRLVSPLPEPGEGNTDREQE